jgi:putative ABC transport system permease protein
VGVISLLLTLGFIRYSFQGLSQAIIRGGLAHLEIAPKEGAGDPASLASRAGMPPAFHDWRPIRQRLERREGITAVSAAIQLAGMLMNGDRTVAFVGAALEPARQRKMDIDVKIRDGAKLADDPPTAGDDKVLLGVELASTLGAKTGDSIVAMVATANGTLNAVDLTVAGIFTTGLQDLDARMAQMHLATGQRLLGTDNVTSLLVGLTDEQATASMAAAIRDDLKAEPQTLVVTDWETRAPFYRQVRGLYIGIFMFLGTIIGLLIALSTSNTFQMAVLERIREFGTLMAMGTSRLQLARLIVLEAMWLALIGGAAGGVLSRLIMWGINTAEIQMPPPPAAVDPITLTVLILPTDFLWAIVFMLVLLVAATIPPIAKIFRLRIVEALSHV